jgi:long-chain acyl-CoA synthetase
MELPTQTLTQMLRRHAQTKPDAVALRQKDFGIWLPVSWAEYFEQASLFARGLALLDISPGGKVGILSENRVEWVLAQMGANIAGGVAVGVYPTSPSVEIAYILEHGDVEIIVCEDQEQTDKVLEASDGLPKLRHIVVIDPKGLRHYEDERIVAFQGVVKSGSTHIAQDPQFVDRMLDRQSLDDTALVVYTSGSTGKPKGALITFANIRATVPGMVESLGLAADDVCLSYLPLCHIAEQVMTNIIPLYTGSQVNFGESLRTVQSDLREIAPTYFFGVPRIWEKMHADILIKVTEAGGFRKMMFDLAVKSCTPDRRKTGRPSLIDRIKYGFFYYLVFRSLQNFIGLRKVRVAMSSAAPISVDVLLFFQTLGVPIREAYGQTEATGMATVQPLDNVIAGTVGMPLSGLELRLSETGEILMKGEQVFAGYYKNPEATAQIIRDGWLYTGDVGEWTDGQIKIVDRVKDIIITAGGKNLSPSEIENTVKASPYIKECVVIGDRRKYVSALIQIEFDTVAKWAEMQKLAFTTFRSLAENSMVREMVQQEIDKANSRLAQVSHIRKFHLLTKELDHDDDEVTATMKIRRANIHQKFSSEIEALY